MTTCFEEGRKDSKILILAEAPARTEIKMDQPLVGASGYELNEWLGEAGISREDCYILNVFEEECFREENKPGNPLKDKYGRELYRPGHFTALGNEKVAGTLKRIDKSTANVIVPLGGTALSLLYGDPRIKRLRGSILESTRFRGRKICGTFHPSFVLRGNYVYKYVCVADFRRVAEEAETPRINLPKRELIVDPSFSEVKAFMRDMKKKKKVATDVEILNHQISCFCFAPSPDISMCIPLFDGHVNKDRWTEEQELQIWMMVQDIIGNPDIMKINQNLLFDLWMYFQQNNVIPRGPYGDPMIANHIVYPDFPKGLDFLCSIHTRTPYYKDDGKIWANPERDPIKFWKYNAMDGAVAFECYEKAVADVDPDYGQLYNDTIDLFEPLLYMMCRGIKMDQVALGITKERVRAEIETKSKELIEVADYPFNVNSPKQCQEYFYAHKGIPAYKSLSTKQPTTDDKAMSKIIKRYGLPEARIVQELRQLNKLFGTYLDINLDRDNRLRCSYNPRGTTSGRLSSSETLLNTGTNMQNLHPEMKEFLISDLD